MKCLQLLLLAGIPWLCVANLVAAERPEKNRYNVIFIAIDDLRPELGCYGVAAAQSPRLDRFAESSIRFDRHYVQVATCGASRYALLTGRSPANSGVRRNNSALYHGSTALNATQQPGAQSMPELFRRSGYRTICIGKISHTPDGRVYAYNGEGDGRPELPLGWNELPTPFGPWQRGWGAFFAYANGKHRESGQGDRDLMEFTAKKDDDLPDGLMATVAIEQLEKLEQGQQPFFLGLGFFKPHLPFVAPRQDWEAFADAEIPLPPQDKTDSNYWHRSGEFMKYDAPYKKSNPLDKSAQQQARRAYYACVRYVDRQVGRVLDAVDRLELADDTIVVIWGDHGWHLGEQQIWGKHTPLERATRSVLMLHVPGASKQGSASSALVETIDIYPTLIDLCQPKFRETRWPLDGNSLANHISDEQPTVRQVATSYWGSAVSHRTETHRLIENGKQVELYDLSQDLDNQTNIAKMHPEVVEQIRNMVSDQ